MSNPIENEWQRKMREYDALEADRLAHTETREQQKQRLEAEKEQVAYERISFLISKLGIVDSLEGINQQVWDGMGSIERKKVKIPVPEQYDRNRIKTYNYHEEVTLVFRYKSYWSGTEDVMETVNGPYEVAHYHENMMEGTSYVDYVEKRKGPHQVKIGFKYRKLTKSDEATFLRITVNGGGISITDSEIEFPDNYLHDMSFKFWPAVHVESSGGREGTATAHIPENSNDVAIPRLREFLDTTLIKNCIERTNRNRLPKNFKAKQDEEWQRESSLAGRVVLYES